MQVGSERTFAFNRRTVEDQTIYVHAASLSDAWRKARAGDCFDTADADVQRINLRRLPAEDGDA